MFQRSCAVASQQRSRSVHWNQKERSWKYLSVVRSHLLYLLKVKMRIAAEGLQPNIVHEIGAIILRLNKEHGLTVLLVEQKLPFMQRVADRFCIMGKGRLMAAGALHELDDALIRRYLTV